ncbi:hypothetical protein [Rahnella ecdela]|uniref:Uncharacterized protein n=1 Tax=Rahnella ecdela TaxID=2816250 RepID=A0ABS6L9S0_9GAMM|nr:hypothetical protein [Rahnella ecdela]MBU9843552.1 hypothetical protein [Rahnella ecdela]
MTIVFENASSQQFKPELFNALRLVNLGVNLMDVRYVSKKKISLWKKLLPLFITHSINKGDPYNYYMVYFYDITRARFILSGYENEEVVLQQWDSAVQTWSKTSIVPVSKINEFESEIIHYRRNGSILFYSITSFYINQYTRFTYAKNLLDRIRGRLTSDFYAKREVKSRDRIALLNLMIKEYIWQKPSHPHAGMRITDIIDMLYGKLWYKHIRNEEFRRKVTLILQSLVITEDLTQKDERYYVQGKSITTVVEHEKEERRNSQYVKIQKNILRLMLIITFSTLVVTVAILSQAGIVDLHNIWEYIINIKPLRFLLKII